MHGRSGRPQEKKDDPSPARKAPRHARRRAARHRHPRLLVRLQRNAEPQGLRRNRPRGRQAGLRGPPRPALRRSASPARPAGTAASSRPTASSSNVTYPVCDIDALIAAGQKAMAGWQAAGAEGRTGICLEILDRLNQQSFELAHAVMMTTGQGWMMAFQAGAPHAQERGLEAVAYAYREQRFVPARGDLGKAAGQEPAAGHEKALRGGRPRRRRRRRLRHLPDLEHLPGPVRRAGDRQRGHRQAARQRHPAGCHYRAHHPRRARRERHRPRPGHAVRRRPSAKRRRSW